MFPSLTIFYDPDTKLSELDVLIENMEQIFEIEIKTIQCLKIHKRAYNRKRKQYDGQFLLNNLIDKKNHRFFIWIISVDLYVPMMSFVFGLASKFYGAIISFSRLDSDEMKIKESIHELGHLLGLSHCSNYCVMQYSISLDEALTKPKTLCDKCKEQISRNKKNFEPNKA